MQINERKYIAKTLFTTNKSMYELSQKFNKYVSETRD